MNTPQNTQHRGPWPEIENIGEPSYDLVVSLGTDYHRFDRLVDWIEQYLEKHRDVNALVQHGFTRAPQNAESVERMPRPRLLKLYQASSVVVVQGGPGSILDAREVGTVPLAVPRLSELDEVVDDHQVQFTRVMDRTGDAVLVESREALFSELDDALARPEDLRKEPRVAQSEEASVQMQQALRYLVRHPRHRPLGAARRVFQLAAPLVAPGNEDRAEAPTRR